MDKLMRNITTTRKKESQRRRTMSISTGGKDIVLRIIDERFNRH